MQNIKLFKSMLLASNEVSIIGHANPDGDAIGSMVALSTLLRGYDKIVNLIVPNEVPRYLHFLNGEQTIYTYKDDCQKVYDKIASSDLIICVDFNDITTRIGGIGELVMASSAKRILIDHHQMPRVEDFDLVFSDVTSSSTAYVVFDILSRAEWLDRLPIEGLNAIYSGMITDTGNFAFSYITPQLMRAAATLIERGVNSVELYNRLFNSQSEKRVRLMSYLISKKMVVLKGCGAAYITFTLAEQQRFYYQAGDSEGVVNMPLSIDGITLSAIFVETTECIKISLRSTIDGVDVNQMARTLYTGGGHINAAGAKSYTTMKEAIAKFTAAARQNKKESR